LTAVIPSTKFQDMSEPKPKEKNKDGRPRISPNSKPLKLTISQDDIDLLEKVCAFTGSRPATMVRELIEESRPTLIAIAEALEAAKNETKPPIGSLAEKILTTALKKELPSQDELFEMVKDSRK